MDTPTAGIYIMVNNGELKDLFNITSLKTYIGQRYIKIYVKFSD